jgi:hypothetical protein
MSLATIQGKLSRAEMKNIMAGSSDGTSCSQTLPCGGPCIIQVVLGGSPIKGTCKSDTYVSNGNYITICDCQ